MKAARRTFPHLNKRPHTFDDVERVAGNLKVNLTVCPYDDNILGYYCTRKTKKLTKKFIVINSKLNEVERTFVGLHELGHVVLHVPLNANHWFYCYRNAKLADSKADAEADLIAAVAMIPLWMLLDDSADVSAHPGLAEIYLRRWKIWRTYEI